MASYAADAGNAVNRKPETDDNINEPDVAIWRTVEQNNDVRAELSW
jgi:hypothetical protein